MPHYNYLIIGGGMTADAAACGIREIDAEGTIGMISEDSEPPYNRPPLTKGLWKTEPFDWIWRHTETKNVQIHLGRRADLIDLRGKQIVDNNQTRYSYDKLLLATGARPRQLPFGNGRIIYYRTVQDYTRLQELVEKKNRFAVIGGGFIGSEIAAALASKKKKVTMIFPGTTIGGRLFPHDLGEFLNDVYRDKGVKVLTNETVTSARSLGESTIVQTRSGREIEVDGVVAGIGIDPNTELAQRAGLHVEDGIIVDEFLRTAHSDVYAAGDVAAFFNPALGRVIRVEHEDNANTMGRVAGRNMAGDFEPYHYLPFFYSDLFDFGYEAVGELDSHLDVIAEWTEPYREGVVYYLREGSIRGVLLWNVWGQIEHARKLIAEGGRFEPKDLRGKLPEHLVAMVHA